MAAGQVDRQRLIQWLESFEQEVTEEQERYQRVLQALRSVLPVFAVIRVGWHGDGGFGMAREGNHDRTPTTLTVETP